MNVLLITLDQFRADCLSSAGHPVVRTPNLDRLAAGGVRFGRHYSQAAPCSPGRACLYTGTYQLNNRVVGNGTPLDGRLDNVALAARRAGYVPTMFGYADQGVDPRTCPPGDARLSNYQGFPPGFEVELELLDDQAAWVEWLRSLGYDVRNGERALATESERPAEHGVSAFMADRVIDWLGHQDGPWFAHVSFWRPHPPYNAAGAWSEAYVPDAMPAPVPAPALDLPSAGRLAAIPAPENWRRLRSQYYGMISAVDHEVGRVLDALVELGMWETTFVALTSDHGEQLGDQGTLGKGGCFEASYAVPCIIRDPRQSGAHGTAVDAFTENVDVMPTVCAAMGVDVPAQCDGMPLSPFLAGERPPWWRTAAHWEYDWRWEFIPFGPHPWPWDRRLDRKHLSVLRTADRAYVQYGDGQARCFDLAADPGWGTLVTDPADVLPLAQEMLVWRSQHADRTLTGMLLSEGGVGRWPSPLTS